MDVRNAGGLVGKAVVALDTFNRRHPWSHNDHFHAWILRNLPANRTAALDVGCGRGELVAALAAEFAHVDGVDVDAEMARIASDRFAGEPRVAVRQEGFEEVSGHYDLITMIAVLHHLDLEPALLRARDLLNDGGRLLVVGLAMASTPLDYAWDLTSAAVNPIVGLRKHPRALNQPFPPPFPVRDPALTFAETKQAATRVLPGARMRHRLFFRFTLEWVKR